LQFQQPERKKRRTLSVFDTAGGSLHCQKYFADICQESFEDEKSLNLDAKYIEKKSNPKKFGMCRKRLLNWMIPITGKYWCHPQTVFKMVYVLDRYLSNRSVPHKELQVVGAAALLLASKYHDRIPLTIRDLTNCCDKSFSKSDLLLQEMEMMQITDCRMSKPTCSLFLDVFLGKYVNEPYHRNLQVMAYYLAECLLVHESFIGMLPSFQASIVMYWCLKIVAKAKWGAAMQGLFGHTEHDFLSFARPIYDTAFPTFKLTGVQRKYFKRHLMIARVFRDATVKAYVRRRCPKLKGQA